MKFLMKLPMAALILASALLAAPHEAAAVVIVDAQLNSSTGGVGISSGVNVVSGDDVSITATGCWSAGSGDQRISDADGIIPGSSNPCNSTANTFGQWTQDGLTANFGSLVGSFDGGATYFLIGSNYNQTVAQSGLLTLYYWDSNPNDNSGSVEVLVTNNGQSTNGGGGTNPTKNLPEPSTIVLIGAGLTGLGVARRRRKSA